MPYVPKTWADGPAGGTPITAFDLNHLENGVSSAYPFYNVMDPAYGAKGDGTTDDTAAIQAALDAAHAAAAAGGRVGATVYLPKGNYAISSPLNLRLSGFVGEPGASELTALAGFSGGNHMVRNWKASDYGVGETDFRLAPLHEATPIFYHHVAGIRFNLGAVANLRGLGIAHPHETSTFRDLIFNAPGTSGVALHVTSTADNVINGMVLVDGVTVYGSGWGTEILIDGGGSDLTLRRWTASPGVHSSSVLSSNTSGFLMDDCHCEGYVDTALVTSTDLAVWRFYGATAGVTNSTLQINPTSTILKHPAIYQTTGNGFTSPLITGLRVSAGAGSGWDPTIPMVKDRSESNLYFTASGQEYQEIYYYDGNVVTWRHGASPARGYFQKLRGNDQNTVYSASMTLDPTLGEYQYINVTNTSAMTIAPAIPDPALNGLRMVIQVANNSGGAMGAITWTSAFKLAGTFTNPASGKSRFIEFMFDGGTHWYELNRGTADV